MSVCSYEQYSRDLGTWGLGAGESVGPKSQVPSPSPGPQSPSGERSELRKDFVVIRLVPCVVEDFAVAHDAVLVDDEDGPPRDAFEADHVLIEDAVVANDLLVEIAQEGKRQLLMVVKRLQREERIDTDAVHHGGRLTEPRQGIAKRAHLPGTDRAEGGREKGQYHGLAAPLAQRDGLAVLSGQREIRGLRSDVDRHEASIKLVIRFGRPLHKTRRFGLAFLFGGGSKPPTLSPSHTLIGASP